MKVYLGIDVGGPRKGFHAVAMSGREFEPRSFGRVDELVKWARELKPLAIAIDAPCAWSADGRSRECERCLRIGEDRISCFSTPSEERAAGRGFYDWVRNGLALYQALAAHYPLYTGSQTSGPIMCETFPQAVACMLAGTKLSARRKSPVRRKVLRSAGYDPDGLSNIDLVDAALCAIAAKALQSGRFEAFGNAREGYIVTPLLVR